MAWILKAYIHLATYPGQIEGLKDTFKWEM